MIKFPPGLKPAGIDIVALPAPGVGTVNVSTSVPTDDQFDADPIAAGILSNSTRKEFPVSTSSTFRVRARIPHPDYSRCGDRDYIEPCY
jgi:hypothetical protein